MLSSLYHKIIRLRKVAKKVVLLKQVLMMNWATVKTCLLDFSPFHTHLRNISDIKRFRFRSFDILIYCFLVRYIGIKREHNSCIRWLHLTCFCSHYTRAFIGWFLDECKVIWTDSAIFKTPKFREANSP